ncbi:hypothetical protein [Alkalibacillus aidingensis]|uniref:hypothetical protein n=1 Tax=Alkalibacillus aidingensis TaxID=2747607 RepID=UPI0016617BD8|nr:hypothetical protein [Alkalibacillus aidingensis]
MRHVVHHLYTEQMKWSFWFLTTLVTARFAHYLMASFMTSVDSSIENIMVFSLEWFKIYMLVIGLLSVYVFLSQTVSHGVSRWNYYRGTLLAAIGIIVTYMIVIALLTLIEILVIQFIEVPVEINQVAFGEMAQLVIHYFVISLLYYVVGWMITAGFYRFGWLIGLGFIIIGFVTIMIADYFWGENELFFNFDFGHVEYPFGIAVMVSIIINVAMLWLVRLITRKVRIKM